MNSYVSSVLCRWEKFFHLMWKRWPGGSMKVRGRYGSMTHDVVEPQVVRIVFTTFFSGVGEDGFDLVFLFVLNVGVYVVGRARLFVVVELTKVLDIVDVVGYLATPA